MLVAGRTECGGDCCLDVGEHCVDRLERGMARSLASGPGDDRLVRAAGIGNTFETAEPVGDDTGAAFHDPSRHSLPVRSMLIGICQTDRELQRFGNLPGKAIRRSVRLAEVRER